MAPVLASLGLAVELAQVHRSAHQPVVTLEVHSGQDWLEVDQQLQDPLVVLVTLEALDNQL